MGTSYGPGIVDLVADAEMVENDPTGETVLGWLLDIAAIGLSRRFRTAVTDRVAEFTNEDGHVTWRWLPDEEAAPILAAGTCFGDTHEEWPSAMDHDLFLPNCTADGPGTVVADGSPLDHWHYTPIEPVITGMRGALAEIDRGDYDGDRETVTDMIGHLEFCRTHHLVLVVV